MVNNTYNIIGLGHENLDQVFSRKEKMAILKNRFYCLPELVEYTHFNESDLGIKTIKVLKKFVKNHIPKIDPKDENFMCEFLLWGLSSYKKVSITRTSRGLSFSDSFSDYINGL